MRVTFWEPNLHFCIIGPLSKIIMRLHFSIIETHHFKFIGIFSQTLDSFMAISMRRFYIAEIGLIIPLD